MWLRCRTQLALLTLPVRGQAPRFVYSRRRSHEQHQQGGEGVGHELDLQIAEIGAGQ